MDSCLDKHRKNISRSLPLVSTGPRQVPEGSCVSDEEAEIALGEAAFVAFIVDPKRVTVGEAVA